MFATEKYLICCPSSNRLPTGSQRNAIGIRLIYCNNPYVSAWLLVILLCFGLGAGNCISVAWSQDIEIPPVSPDRIREIATDRQRQVTILWAGPLQIRVQSAGGQQMLNRNQYEIVAWDGDTNAAEILVACEQRLKHAMVVSEAIELGDAADETVVQLKREQQLITEALKRIRPQADFEYQRAQELLSQLLQVSVERAEARHAVLRQAWRKMGNLAFALRDEQFQKLPEVYQQIRRELDALVASYRDQHQQEVARAVVERLNDVLSGLLTAAAQFSPLPDDVRPAEVTGIALALRGIREQASSLDSVTGTVWLGKDIHNWFLERQGKLDRHRVRFEELQRVIGGLPVVAKELAALQATLTEPTDADWAVFERQFAVLEEKLNDEVTRLGHQRADDDDDDDVRYATEHLAELRNTLQQTRRNARLQILERDTIRCLNAASAATTSREARESSAKLAVWIQSWEALPKSEYEAPVQLRIRRTIDRLRLARMECAVHVARAEVNQVRSDLDRILAETPAASLAQHAGRFETWNASLETSQQELQVTIEAGTGIRPPHDQRIVRQQAEALRQDLGCATTLTGIHQDLSQLPTTIKTMNEWNRRLAHLDSLEERTKTIPTNSHSLQRLLTQTHTAVDAGRDMLERERPRIEFEEAVEGLQQQLSVLDAALQIRSISLARREYQTAASSLQHVNALLRRTPALAATPSFKARIQNYNRQTREFALHLEALVAECRREAGWQPLVTPEKTLAAPTPEDEILRIELRLSQGQFAKAEAELDQLLVSHPQPPWPARANVLKTRLDYYSAVTWEEAGDLSSAQRTYEKLASNTVDPTIATAAQSAWRRSEVRRQRANRDQQARLLAGLLGAILLPMLAGSLFLVWRSSSGQRLRRAGKRWEAARQAALSGNFEQRDRALQAVAETLAKFPENHPDASRLREQMFRSDAIQRVLAVPRHVPNPALTESGALDAALTSIDLQGVPECLVWLHKCPPHDRNQARCQQVVRWLAERLMPNAQMRPERLDQLADYAIEVHSVVPQQTWPILYAVCARWWKGDCDEASVLAQSLPEDLEALPGSGRLRLALAVCWWKTGKCKAAIGLLRLLLEDTQEPEVRTEAKRWLGVIRGARPSATAKNAGSTIADRVGSLLRH